MCGGRNKKNMEKENSGLNKIGKRKRKKETRK